MNFIKNFFKHDDVIGLTSLKKKTEYIYIEIPQNFKKTYVPNTENNYLLYWLFISAFARNKLNYVFDKYSHFPNNISVFYVV